MALNIIQDKPVSRPVIGGGVVSEDWKELLPVVEEAMKLDESQAMPLRVKAEDGLALVAQLRRAGSEKKVTIRFKNFPKMDKDGKQELTGKGQKLNTPLEVLVHESGKDKGKPNGQVRVTFWTTAQILRPRTNSKDSQEPAPGTQGTSASGKPIPEVEINPKDGSEAA